MKMKRIIALLTALVLALALTACGETKPNDDVQQGGAAVEKKITIGCCVMDLSNEVFVQYAEGYNQFLKDTKGTVEINLVDGGTDNTSEAMTAMESVLQAHPEVRMVLCAQDSAAVGAYQAVISSGLPQEEFFVAGCDGISEALGYIEEGTPYRLSIANAKLTSQMGYELVQNVSMAVAGLDYESPYYAAVAAVNADNVKDYLAQTPTYTLNPELAAYLGIN